MYKNDQILNYKAACLKTTVKAVFTVQRGDHFKTIIPCTHAIKPNAMGYIILIVPSYDPNLDKVALSQFSAWVRFVDLCVNVQSKHYPEIMIKDD